MTPAGQRNSAFRSLADSLDTRWPRLGAYVLCNEGLGWEKQKSCSPLLYFCQNQITAWLSEEEKMRSLFRKIAEEEKKQTENWWPLCIISRQSKGLLPIKVYIGQKGSQTDPSQLEGAARKRRDGYREVETFSFTYRVSSIHHINCDKNYFSRRALN